MEDFIAMCSKSEFIVFGIWSFGVILGFAMSTVITLGDYLCQLIVRKISK